MEKTIKQMSDEIGISKQKIYRYIKKNNINEVYQQDGAMYYDEVVQSQIKQEFTQKEVHQEVHQMHINEVAIEMLSKQLEVLQNELEIKNKQIAEMQKLLDNEQKLLDQEQQLSMSKQQQLLQLEEQKEEKKWYHFFKK